MSVAVYSPSPTLDEFHRDDSFVRGVMGCFGSGKSTAMCMEIYMRAQKQAPCSDGIRRSRWVIIRNTFGQLQDTTWKTWSQWFPVGVYGEFKVTDFAYTLRVGDIECEILFRALDRPDHISKLLSLELTGAWINEAGEVPKAILDGVTGRVGRYPSTSMAPLTWCGVIMDTNPPDDDHWWYRSAEVDTPDGWRFWQQPGGLHRVGDKWVENPAAENISFLPGGYQYYLRMLSGKSEEWISAYIGGQYGIIGTGRPVYPEYNDTIHCARGGIVPIIGLPLVVGMDLGLSPAGVLTQLTPTGRLNVLKEWTTPAGSMGIRQFSRDVFGPGLGAYLEEHRKGGPAWDIVLSIDPAGVQRAQTDERTCLDILKEEGFTVRTARTNSFLARREAVAHYLTTLVDGVGALQIDAAQCPMLRKGFLGRYFYERLKIVGDERFRDTPCKNIYSHCADSMQYSALYNYNVEAYKKKSDHLNRMRQPSQRKSASRAGY